MNAPVPSIVATFRPQQWTGPRNDHPHPAGEPRTIDVTEQVLQLSLRELHALEDHNDSSDRVVPYALHRHDGPFEVEVEQSVADFFGVDRVQDVTAEQLQEAKTAHRIGEERDFEVALSRTAVRHATITVRATSAVQASELALERAGDIEFPHETEADYEVQSARPIAAARRVRP